MQHGQTVGDMHNRIQKQTKENTVHILRVPNLYFPCVALCRTDDATVRTGFRSEFLAGACFKRLCCCQPRNPSITLTCPEGFVLATSGHNAIQLREERLCRNQLKQSRRRSHDEPQRETSPECCQQSFTDCKISGIAEPRSLWIGEPSGFTSPNFIKT